jgi:hypothetical protein
MEPTYRLSFSRAKSACGQRASPFRVFVSAPVESEIKVFVSITYHSALQIRHHPRMCINVSIWRGCYAQYAHLDSFENQRNPEHV